MGLSSPLSSFPFFFPLFPAYKSLQRVKFLHLIPIALGSPTMMVGETGWGWGTVVTISQTIRSKEPNTLGETYSIIGPEVRV